MCGSFRRTERAKKWAPRGKPDFLTPLQTPAPSCCGAASIDMYDVRRDAPLGSQRSDPSRCACTGYRLSLLRANQAALVWTRTRAGVLQRSPQATKQVLRRRVRKRHAVPILDLAQCFIKSLGLGKLVRHTGSACRRAAFEGGTNSRSTASSECSSRRATAACLPPCSLAIRGRRRSTSPTLDLKSPSCLPPSARRACKSTIVRAAGMCPSTGTRGVLGAAFAKTAMSLSAEAHNASRRERCGGSAPSLAPSEDVCVGTAASSVGNPKLGERDGPARAFGHPAAQEKERNRLHHVRPNSRDQCRCRREDPSDSRSRALPQQRPAHRNADLFLVGVHVPSTQCPKDMIDKGRARMCWRPGATKRRHILLPRRFHQNVGWAGQNWSTVRPDL